MYGHTLKGELKLSMEALIGICCSQNSTLNLVIEDRVPSLPQQGLGGRQQTRAAQVGLGSCGLGVGQVPFDQDRAQSQPPGTLEFVIAAVAGKGALTGAGPERVQRHLVDPGIRLEQAGRPGHGQRVDAVAETEGAVQLIGPGRPRRARAVFRTGRSRRARVVAAVGT